MQLWPAQILTSALLFAVAFESGEAATQEVSGQVAALGVGHASGRHCRVVTLVDVCNRAANWPYFTVRKGKGWQWPQSDPQSRWAPREGHPALRGAGGTACISYLKCDA